jgi:hypothetical protein
MKKIIAVLFLAFTFFIFNNYAEAIVEPGTKEAQEASALMEKYSKVTKDPNIVQALEALKGTPGEYSQKAILGDNLTFKPITIEYKNLSEIDPVYGGFDALGWKKKNRLYIYLNPKHRDAPKEALCALLAHEALHQDELNSINEETYAWTLEAAVWTMLVDNNPRLENISHPLVERENTIRQLFIKGDYTDRYIRKSILSNSAYQNLPSRSPGFEDNL